MVLLLQRTIEMANGIIITTKAIVSSLIPKMAPNKLNIVIINIITILLTPTFLRALFFSNFRIAAINPNIPISNAFVEFNIQNAPPINNIKTIISA